MAAELAKIENGHDKALEAGFSSDVGLNLLFRSAKYLSMSELVPNTYRDKPANCMIALNMARQMGVDPLMCMQNLYIVKGHPAWSAQFMIACFNQCGRFTSIRFEFFGEKGKDDYGCRATATEKSTGDVLTGPDITIATAKKEEWYTNKKWQNIPELMLRYRAASWFIRTIAPEIAMGFHTVDELQDGLGAYDADAEIVNDAAAALPPKSALDAVVDAAKAPEVDNAPKARISYGGEPGPEDIAAMQQAAKTGSDTWPPPAGDMFGASTAAKRNE